MPARLKVRQPHPVCIKSKDGKFLMVLDARDANVLKLEDRSFDSLEAIHQFLQEKEAKIDIAIHSYDQIFSSSLKGKELVISTPLK
jgi:hypothetical protein